MTFQFVWALELDQFIAAGAQTQLFAVFQACLPFGVRMEHAELVHRFQAFCRVGMVVSAGAGGIIGPKKSEKHAGSRFISRV